jgi:hypothetical protein
MLRQINDNVIAVKGEKGVTECREFNISDSRLTYFTDTAYDDNVCRGFDLPPGKWKILGKLDDMTEAQKFEVCHAKDFAGRRMFHVFGKYYPSEVTTQLDKSFQSFLDANKLYSVNPLGEKEPEIREYTNDELEGLPSIKEWQAAEDNTGDWLIILREGE